MKRANQFAKKFLQLAFEYVSEKYFMRQNIFRTHTMTITTCNDKYLQAHTEHVPHLAGERRLPESISHKFTHHEFQFIKVSISIPLVFTSEIAKRAIRPVISAHEEEDEIFLNL